LYFHILSARSTITSPVQPAWVLVLATTITSKSFRIREKANTPQMGYASLVYETYQLTKSKIAQAQPYWNRFDAIPSGDGAHHSVALRSHLSCGAWQPVRCSRIPLH